MNDFLKREQREPSLWETARNGVLVDAGLLRHLICNAEKPVQVSEDDFLAVVEAVIDAVTMLPVEAEKWPER